MSKLGWPKRPPMMPRMTAVTAAMIGAKAPPMMTPTARSIALPREMNSLKPFNTGLLELGQGIAPVRAGSATRRGASALASTTTLTRCTGTATINTVLRADPPSRDSPSSASRTDKTSTSGAMVPECSPAPAGTVLSEHLLVGPGLVAPAGHVVLPVAVADAGSLALARPGTEITLLAGAGEHSGTIAPDVLVLSVLEAEDGESLLGGSARNTVLIVAVPVHLVSVVVDASAEAPLRVALPARTGAIP